MIHGPPNTSDGPTLDCCFAQFPTRAPGRKARQQSVTPTRTSYAPGRSTESTSDKFRAGRTRFNPDIPAEVVPGIGTEALVHVDRTKVEPPSRRGARSRHRRSRCHAALPISSVRRRRHTIGIFDGLINFFDQEHDALLVAFGDLHLVAGFPDQVRNIDHRQRISAVNFEEITGRNRLQRLARFQRRQRTFQAGEIECCLGHVTNMAKRRLTVKWRFRTTW